MIDTPDMCVPMQQCINEVYLCYQLQIATKAMWLCCNRSKHKIKTTEVLTQQHMLSLNCMPAQPSPSDATSVATDAPWTAGAYIPASSEKFALCTAV